MQCEWSRIIVQILWRKPYFDNERVIKICLLELNADEQVKLVPFRIDLPKKKKFDALFDYASFIKHIDQDLNIGMLDFFKDYFNECYPVTAVKSSLISMFLRKSKNLNTLSRIFLGYFGWKAITDALCENSTLTSLDLSFSQLGSEGGIALANNALCKNNTLTTLVLSNNNLGSDVGIALADTLCKNTTLTSLNLSSNRLGFDGGKALAKALCKNKTLTALTLSNNNLGSVVRKNNALTSLDLSCNQLGSNGGKALSEALCENKTLTTLNLLNMQLGLDAGLALANALRKNNILNFLNISFNDLEVTVGKMLFESLRVNTALTSLIFIGNQFEFEEFEVKNLLKKNGL